MKPFILLLVLALLLAQSSWPQNSKKRKKRPSKVLKVPKISGGITFDGKPDEAPWQIIRPLPMMMFTPVYGEAPAQPTLVRVAYDRDYFYVCGTMNYEDPGDIRAVGKKRDYASSSTDFLGLIIDTFNDHQNAVSFHTNPNGLRTDATIKNDGHNLNSDLNFSWNTFWDVKTNLTDRGWTAEFRIPFSSLRFQSHKGKTRMGLTVMRYSAAKNEMSIWPPVPSKYNAPMWKPSLCCGIEFEEIKAKQPLYVTPYLTAGGSMVNELNESGSAWHMKTTPKYDAGLDVKYSITNNLTSDLTINTDFAQVEADQQRINLTRYSLFFPEKRPFFLEKADVFDFSFLEGNNLFYSRRIGLYDGNPVRIYGGLRLTGRAGKWDLGLLDMQTEAYRNNPGENFGVVRLKRSVFNSHSFAGGMLTSRIGTDGSYNTAYGLDGLFRVTGDEYLTLRWAQTFEQDSSNAFLDRHPSRALIRWQRRRENGLGYDLLYTFSGKQFHPGIGFEVKDNYQGPRAIVQYGWLTEHPFIRYQKLTLTGLKIWNTALGVHETTHSSLLWFVEAKNGSWWNLSMNWSWEKLRNELTLGNNQSSVPAGTYSFPFFQAGYSTTKANALVVYCSGETGKFYDGYRLSLYANPQLKIGSSFDLGLTYYFDYIDFPERSSGLTNHIAGFKGLMTLTTRTSLSAFVQYNTAINRVIVNTRFRYNPREGNDFYIVYDEGLNTRMNREIPTLPTSNGRSILVKYTYTFSW